MVTKEKAISIAKSARRGFKILKIIERPNSYVISMAPNGYNESMGVFCDGAVIIDKKTGELSTYNPIFDD